MLTHTFEKPHARKTQFNRWSFSNHQDAESAVKELQKCGYDMKKLSVVGKDHHSEENVIGYYNKDHKVLEHRQIRLSGQEGNRVVILAMEALLPRDEPEPVAAPEQAKLEEKSPERSGREELYEDIKDAAQCSRVYLGMVVLSTIVAAVGLYYNSVAIIIGAMVIALLLGPNMALSIGTTLGDLSLLRRAINRPHSAVSKELTMSSIRL